MKNVLLAAVYFFLLAPSGFTQLTVPQDGGSKRAMVVENIGLTKVSIHYSRPALNGREGKIWGQLVHYGFINQGFGTSKSAPWRAGANESTTIEFSTPVRVEGKEVPAGKYGLFIAYDSINSILILSKNNSSWGSYFYNEQEDQLRVPVKAVPNPDMVEFLKYEFTNQQLASAVVSLQWEYRKIPFKIECDYIALQMESFRKELRTNKGFDWRAFVQAANFTLQNDINLEEGLAWADKAINENFIGERNFVTLSTKAQLLEKMNRSPEAVPLIKEAMPLATMRQLHTYGRQLLSQKKNKEAFDAFKMNYDKYPNQFTTNTGMARGYSANGNYKKALEFAEKALAQAPDPANKSGIERMIGLLREGKDGN